MVNPHVRICRELQGAREWRRGSAMIEIVSTPRVQELSLTCANFPGNIESMN